MSFASILGQSKALAALQGTLRSGRFHHAWIFRGPPGVGKFTTATEVARILMDPGAGPNLAGVVEADPEGETSRLIDAGAHPDLHVVYKELALYSENPMLRQRKLINIPLDLLREKMLGGRTSDDRYHEAAAYRTPVLGYRKVFILDEAELIDPTGQNALLKTLEEPPANTYIFLITSHPERLLPTIRSRCQAVQFLPLEEAELTRWFERQALELSAPQRRWIERFCDGSPGTALLAARYDFYRWQQELEPMFEQLAAQRFPPGLGEALASLVEEFAAKWVKENENASKDAANKAGTRHLLRLLGTHARQQLQAVCARQEDPIAWLEVIDLLPAAERHLEANVNMKQVMENLAAQWADRWASPLNKCFAG